MLPNLVMLVVIWLLGGPSDYASGIRVGLILGIAANAGAVLVMIGLYVLGWVR